MTNSELFDAIAFTYQGSVQCSYPTKRQEVMLEHLRKLLAIQLARAQQEATP